LDGYIGNPQLRAAVFTIDGPFLSDGFFTDRALTEKLRAAVFAELSIEIIGRIGTFGADEVAFHNLKLIIQNQVNRTFYF
jgi:hypothetical protein